MINKIIGLEDGEPPPLSIENNLLASNLINSNSLETNSLQNGILSINYLDKRDSKANEFFTISSTSDEFRNKYYPEASNNDWNSWQWQLKNRVHGLSKIEKIIKLSEDEKKAISLFENKFLVTMTPYYASLAKNSYIKKTVIPITKELIHSPEENFDPLGEDKDSPVPGIVHRYPDRVLLLVTKFCTSNCRYCTRSRIMRPNDKYRFKVNYWEKALNYIEQNKNIRDVLLSGGDPLIVVDNKIEYLLSRLRQIPHVEIIRIGTKAPVVLPQRITINLLRILKKYQPLYLSIHFTHPNEITPEVSQACNRLADYGIPLGSQTVLLAGINDNIKTMKTLFHNLLKIRVRPYYLYQCDPIVGSAHFRTPIEKGLEIINGLRGHTSGYAIPTFVIDAPDGGGKIPLLPNYVDSINENDIILKNYKGLLYKYPLNKKAKSK
ncbi:MAG: KamA family radical SAM protein [Pseudomonadota bacterium]